MNSTKVNAFLKYLNDTFNVDGAHPIEGDEDASQGITTFSGIGQMSVSSTNVVENYPGIVITELANKGNILIPPTLHISPMMVITGVND